MIIKIVLMRFSGNFIKTFMFVGLCCLHSVAFSKEPANYQQAHDLFYQSFYSYSLSNAEKMEQWSKVNRYLESQPNFNLSALTLFKLASTAAAMGNFEDYRRWYELLERLNSARQNQVVFFLMQKAQFDYHFNQNEFLQAIQLGRQLLAKQIYLSVSDTPEHPDLKLSIPSVELIDIQNTLGKAHYQTGEYDEANQLFLQALQGFEKAGNKKGIGHVLNNLSVIAWIQQDLTKALMYLERGLAISVEIGDVKSIIAKLSNKGVYHTGLNQIEAAIDAFQQVLNHPQVNEFPLLRINTLLALSEINSAEAEFEEAESFINEALGLAEESRNLFSVANAKRHLAELKGLTKDYDLAIKLDLEALQYYQEKTIKKEQTTVLLHLSDMYRALQDPTNALKYFTLYHQIYQEMQQQAQQESVNELQEKYQAKFRLEQIEALKQENELRAIEVKVANNQKTSLVIYGFAALVIILLFVNRYFSYVQASRLKKHNEEIQAREQQLLLLSNAFKSTSDGVWITDEDFNVIAVNDAFLQLTQRFNSVGRKMAFAHVGGQDEELTRSVLSIIAKEGYWEGEAFDRKASGEVYPIDIKIESIKNDEGEITHYLGAFRDISKRRAAEKKLHELATHDELTGLPNRVLFKELIHRSILNYQRSKIVPVVFFVDVDGFKKLNDSLGHEIGNQFICRVAKRISSSLRSKDVVARIGGDEFGVLVELSGEDLNAASIAKKILRAFDRTFNQQERTLKISVSIGVAVYPDDLEGSDDPEELIRKSDIAMNVAKQAGKNTFSFYKQHMNEAVIELLDQEQRIADAIDNQYFEFHYQPIVDVSRNIIVGAEALIRGRKPGGNLVFPDQFIPTAEKTGLIERIDEIVIDKVFSQINQWNNQNVKLKHVSINLSARIFSQADKLFRLLESSLANYSILSSQVKIEITESMLVDDIEQVIKTMQHLKKLGFTLAIDDFGTGFSSLNYLKQFPVDVLKIDRSFIMDMQDSYKNKSIVHAIVDLAHNLDFSVIAEGVELVEQLDELKTIKCEEYQGYYFSRPIAVGDFKKLVQQQR